MDLQLIAQPIAHTPEALLTQDLYILIDRYGLKPLLDRLAIIVSEECVTLRPDQSEQIRTFLELASEEIN